MLGVKFMAFIHWNLIKDVSDSIETFPILLDWGTCNVINPRTLCCWGAIQCSLQLLAKMLHSLPHNAYTMEIPIFKVFKTFNNTCFIDPFDILISEMHLLGWKVMKNHTKLFIPHTAQTEAISTHHKTLNSAHCTQNATHG